MRVISQYPGYKFQIRPQRQESLGDGSIRVTQPPIYAEFLPVHSGAMIYQNEVATALQHFDFRGNTQSEDEATPTDPVMRLSVFDTEESAEILALTDDEKKLVEDRLLQLCAESPGECLLVTDKPIEAPFPNYDTWAGDPEELVARIIEDGWDPEHILYYERVFGMKRDTVIAALEAQVELGRESVVEA